MDGAGGDDGADVVAPVPGGFHVFEIKSFTGRLNAGRKKQVEKSLETATAKRPSMIAWTLVLPLNPSPAEERWLAGLQSSTGVTLAWMGLTQLEASFTE